MWSDFDDWRVLGKQGMWIWILMTVAATATAQGWAQGATRDLDDLDEPGWHGWPCVLAPAHELVGVVDAVHSELLEMQVI